MLKTILTRALVAVFIFAQSIRAEEASIVTALSSTTLSGYVDTSASWWVGTQRYNDSVTNPIPLLGASISIDTNSLPLSTLEPNEPTGPQQSGSLWYVWNVLQSGVARISFSTLTNLPSPSATSTVPALSDESIFYPWGGISHGSYGVEQWNATSRPGIYIGFERWWTRIAVYRASQNSDGRVAIDFVQRGNYLEFDTQAGEHYWIAIEVYENAPAYEGQPEIPSNLPAVFYFDVTPPPANDSFLSNFSIADSAGGIMTGHLLGATREPNEPNLGSDFASGSVWFHYTAATFGTVTIGSSENTAALAVFTGSEISNLKLVAKSAAGALSFFGEEGKLYHIAVYAGPLHARPFNLPVSGPKYRLYETTLDALMPAGLLPHFYGLRGVTILFYAKTATGWNCVEIEPIVNQTADLLIRPASAADGQLRVITIDETLPAPRIQLRLARGVLVPDVIGYPGQTCAISYSTDLINWSTPQVHTLASVPLSLAAIRPTAPTHFFRVTQSLPQPTSPQVTITDPPPATANPVGLGYTATLSNFPGSGEPLPLTPLVLVSIPGQP